MTTARSLANGDADTAIKLKTARTINSVSFDGTANITITAPAGADIVSVLSAGTTAVAYNTYVVITAGITVTLPASPSAGTWVNFSNRSTNSFTIARNATNIMGLAEDMIVNIQAAGLKLVYTDATRGWVII